MTLPPNQRDLFARDLEERFRSFHARHPEVYAALLALARQYSQRGYRHVGMQHLIEVVRWQMSIARDADELFKINNDYAAGYARLLMRDHPDLRGIFRNRASVFDHDGALPVAAK